LPGHEVPRLSLSGRSGVSLGRQRVEPAEPAGPKNKFVKNGKFFDAENDREDHHVLPATPHTITIKKPCSARCFSQNPQQKRTSSPN
jgi:hypothetical protein